MNNKKDVADNAALLPPLNLGKGPESKLRAFSKAGAASAFVVGSPRDSDGNQVL